MSTSTAASNKKSVTDAGTPFNDPDADVILRSADNVDFRVFKVLMSLASPFFKTMFGLPQTQKEDNCDEMKDGLPVVQVTEESKTLEMLLSMCYPMAIVDPPTLEMLEDVCVLLDAAIKYNLERVEKRVRGYLVEPRFLEIDPVRVYAIACHYRLEAEAKLAAKATVFKPLWKRPYGAELELITGAQLHLLLQYHDNCVDSAKNLTTDFAWIEQTSELSWFNCGYCSKELRVIGTQSRNVDTWWCNYMREFGNTLEMRNCDYTSLMDTTVALMDKALQGATQSCGGRVGRAREDLLMFHMIVMTKIKEVTAEVRFSHILGYTTLTIAIDRFHLISIFSDEETG